MVEATLSSSTLARAGYRVLRLDAALIARDLETTLARIRHAFGAA